MASTIQSVYVGGDGNNVVLTDPAPETITWANAAGHTSWNDAADGSWHGPQGGRYRGLPRCGDDRESQSTAAVSVAGITIDNSQADYSITQTGTQTLTVGSGGITVSTPGSTTADTTTISPNLVLAANETLTAANNTGVTTLTVSGGISGGYNLSTAGSGNVNFNGAVATGSGSLTAGGTGTVTLAAANTFSGGVAIKSGAASGTVAAAFGTGTITIGDSTGSSNATLSGGGAVTFANPISVASGNAGIATITSSAAATFSGAVTLNSHDLLLAPAVSLLTLTGGVHGSGNLALSAPLAPGRSRSRPTALTTPARSRTTAPAPARPQSAAASAAT